MPGSHSQKGTKATREMDIIQRLRKTEGPGMVELQVQEQSTTNRQPFIIQLLTL
jgi:hypothetical protein